MKYQKPNLLHYRIAQAASWIVATFIFRRKILRNEIKDKSGPFVVIANHEAALDFVNLIGATKRPMTFVISNSFYNTLPVKGFMNKMGVIPKQQFQSTVTDLKRIKAVIDRGEPVVIYPAGLMCEDGLSTPIPGATYKFLKWLNVDVYAARTTGTYFVMPKWGKGFRPGQTTLDIYRLFRKEELAHMPLDEVKRATDEALCFDAYREQEENRIRYMGGRNIQGIENVLYMCPHCLSEFTMEVNRKEICCTGCGYTQSVDKYGFFHKGDKGYEIRYASDWSWLISKVLREKIEDGTQTDLSMQVAISMIDHKKNKFLPVGAGTLTLTPKAISLDAQINGEERILSVGTASLPSLPFSPGKYLEVQHGSDIYRCMPENGRMVMKCINMLKIYHEMQKEKQEEPAVVR